MTQLQTHIPARNPAPPLRLTRATDSQRESVPNASPSPTPQQSPSPQAAGPKPQADPADPPLDQLFSLYIDPNLTIADVAFSLGITIYRALQLIRQQDFRTLLEGFAQEHELRAEYLARCNLDTAARTFLRLAEFSDKPETARKAAGAIVRMQQDTKPQKVSPETQLKAAATLLNIKPPPEQDIAPPPSKERPRRTNAPERSHTRPSRSDQRLADALGITPENAAEKAKILERRIKEIDDLTRQRNYFPHGAPPSREAAPEAKPGSGSPGKTRAPQPS